MLHNPTLRVIDILEAVSSRNGELTMSDIARLTGIPRGTIMPILQTLCEKRFLNIDQQSMHYYIGLRCFLCGSSFAKSSDSYSGISSIVHTMAKESGETAHFCLLESGDVLYVVKAESSHHIRMYSEIGRKLPAYGTAVGKALLSDLSFDQLQELYPHGLTPLTSHTITDIHELYEQLLRVRSTGFAYECEESNLGIRCIATPVRYDNVIVAAISIVIPIFRYDEHQRERFEHILFGAARDLERLVPFLDMTVTK